jgi:2-hydroxy-6-oxonona-2,4-dienedioate hydrolase
MTYPATLAEVARLDRTAITYRTDCGPDSTMVWRKWGSGPNLVLIHGGAGTWMHWIRNIDVLAERHTVWAPDLPAFGDSDVPPGRLDADTIAPCVGRGLTELLKGEPFDLVGFSFGGLVSGLIAAEQPQGLRKLVLVSVAALGIVAAPPAFQSLRGVEGLEARLAVLKVNLNRLMIADLAKIDDAAVEIQNWGTARERAKNRTLPLTDILLGLAPRWRGPIYGIWGEEDPVYREQLPELRKKTARLGLRRSVFLKGTGHWLQYETPAEFNAQLLSILGEEI